MNRLLNKVAVVTGAASGIGAATAAALAEEGASVVVADIDAQGAERQAQSIVAQGGNAAAVVVDLADEESIRAMMDFAVARFGGLDVLDNNAADTRLSSTKDSGVENMDVAVWDSLMRTNLRG